MSLPALANDPISVRILPVSGVGVGDTISLEIEMFSPYQLGGIDFTLQYRDTILTFLDATQQNGLNNWEFFDFSSNDSLATVSIVAIADVVNGPIHPDSADLHPNGVITNLVFTVGSNWQEPNSQIGFDFFWAGCGDNAASNPWGDTLIVENRIFATNGILLWDEADDLQFPESSRPPNFGIADSCVGYGAAIKYLIDFHNGSASNGFICGDADGSGTVNITDAVFIIDFVFGSGSVPQPLAAGDANCDSFTNVSDAVYLVQYIFADGSVPCAGCP